MYVMFADGYGVFPYDLRKNGRDTFDYFRRGWYEEYCEECGYSDDDSEVDLTFKDMADLAVRAVRESIHRLLTHDNELFWYEQIWETMAFATTYLYWDLGQISHPELHLICETASATLRELVYKAKTDDYLDSEYAEEALAEAIACLVQAKAAIGKVLEAHACEASSH